MITGEGKHQRDESVAEEGEPDTELEDEKIREKTTEATA